MKTTFSWSQTFFRILLYFRILLFKKYSPSTGFIDSSTGIGPTKNISFVYFLDLLMSSFIFFSNFFSFTWGFVLPPKVFASLTPVAIIIANLSSGYEFDFLAKHSVSIEPPHCRSSGDSLQLHHLILELNILFNLLCC